MSDTVPREELQQAQTQRNLLADALTRLLKRVGVLQPDVHPKGPELLTVTYKYLDSTNPDKQTPRL